MSVSPGFTVRPSLLRTLSQWHWVSAAMALAGLVLFSITGVTLNHANLIEAKPEVVTRTATLPPVLTQALASVAESADNDTPVPGTVRDWARQNLDLALAESATAEWSAEEVYVSLPEPGGDAWLRIDLESGAAEYERTTRGAIAYLNDLHKGRHTGLVWQLFLDVIAVACLVFALSGLWILKLHAANRPFTWPLTALGLVLPVLIALLFIH